MSKAILVVDDDLVIVNLLKAMIGRTGYTAVLAHNGQEALDKHATVPIDLILLDLAMPGMDGYAVLREIRQREKSSDIPRIPILFLTAHMKNYIEDDDLLQQIDGIITKPVTLNQLQTELTKYLGE